jgi:hypothetical protein
MKENTEFTINGDIPNSNIEKIRSCISEIFNLDNIKNSKQDIYLENDVFSLYIYMNDIIGPYPSGNYDFLVSSSYNGSLDETIIFLKSIALTLNKKNVEYNFEFYEDNSDIDDKYDTYIIKHPNWKANVLGIVIDILEQER